MQKRSGVGSGGDWNQTREEESDGARDGNVSVAQYVMPSPYS